MQQADLEEFSKLMRRLMVVYEKEITEEMVDIYYDILKKYEIKEVIRAVNSHLETSKYFPKPAELLIIASKKPGWENFF